MPRVSRTVSSAAESADKLAAPAEAGRPHKAARVAPSKLPDSTSTLCGATSYGSIPDDAQLAPFESHITGCSVSFSRAHSSAGSTASSTACASPAQSASDTGSRCWSAPSSPFVRLDGPALTDKAGLRPIARTCDEPRRESRGADRETACATSGEGGGAGASASDGGGSAVLSVDSILRLPLALAEQQVYTFFETSLGVDDPKDLERTMKSVSTLLERYSQQCDCIEPDPMSFKAPHRAAVRELSCAQGDVMLVLLYASSSSPIQFLGVLAMRSRRRDARDWTVALIHTPAQCRRRGFAARMWAKAERELPAAARVSIEAPQCLAPAARRFWTHPGRGFHEPQGADAWAIPSIYEVIDTVGRAPPAPRITLSYEKHPLPRDIRASKPRLF